MAKNKTNTDLIPISSKFTLNTKSNKKSTKKSTKKTNKKEDKKKTTKTVDKNIAPVEIKQDERFTVKTPDIKPRTQEEEQAYQQRKKESQSKLKEGAKYTGKKSVSGLTKGVTNFIDAPLQNIQEGEIKGQQDSLLKNISKTILSSVDQYGISNIPELTKNAYNRFTNKDLTTWQKISQTGLEIMNNNYYTNKLESIGRVAQTIDPVTKIYNKATGSNVKSSEGLGTVRDVVNTPSDKVEEWAEKDKDKVGKVGQTIGSAAEVTANMIPSIVATAITHNPNVGLAVMGISAKGGATREAEKKGADISQANDIGFFKGLLEVATEKIYGGVGKLFGKGALDDIAQAGLDRIIKNKGINYVLKKGMDIIFEWGEETISDVVDTLIDKGTVDPSASYSFDQWKETGLMTALSTIFLNLITGGYAPGTYIENSTQIEKNSQSKNAQKIIENELEERINTEYNGKATPKEIAQVQREIIEDMQKGYISTNTIEKTLGGKTYNKLESINQEKNKIQEQIDELERKAEKNELSSLEEKQKLNDLKEQIKTIDDTEIRNQLNKEIQETIKNDKGLQESYNEVGRRKESYKVDLDSIQDEKQRAVYQKAMESGVLNNSNKAHALVDMIAKISSEKNIDFDFTNNEQLEKSGFGLQGNVFEVRDANGKLISEFRTEAEAKNYISKLKNSGYKIENVFKNINGYESKNGIVINLNSTRAINRIVGHELTHTFEGTTLYTELQDSLKEFVGESRWNELVEQYEERYKDTDANAENELTSDLIGDYLFTDENYVRNLSVKHKTIFDKAYEQIKYLYNVATAGSSERRMIEKAKKVFDKLYNETKATVENKETKTETKNKTQKVEKIDESVYNDMKIGDVKNISTDEVLKLKKSDGGYRTEQQQSDLKTKIIRENGVKDPIEVSYSNGEYKLENGHHRLQYAKELGFDEVPVKLVESWDSILPSKEGALNEQTTKGISEKNGVSRNSEGMLPESNGISGNKGTTNENARISKTKSNGIKQTSGNENSGNNKEVDNTSFSLSTKNNDIKYSISRETGKLQENGNDVTLETSDVGNTGTLMAIHNLSEDKLKGILELGGFPVPSIAITNPDIVNHNQFGDISVLFDKSTIDPAIAENEAYDRDVWTPTFPTIEYDLNTKVIERARKAVGGFGNTYLSTANSFLNNIEDKVNNQGLESVIEDLKNDKNFKYVYYKSLNPDFELLTKQDSQDLSSDYSNAMLKEFADEYGEIPKWTEATDEQRKDIVEKFTSKLIPYLEERASKIIAEEEAKENPRKFIIGIAKSSVEHIKELSGAYGWQDELLKNLNKIQNEGITRTVYDYEATNNFIDENIDQTQYEKWIDELFDGLVAKKGIYNGKEYLTSIGNRRTFNQLHEDYNLQNLVKILTSQDTVAGQKGFGAGSGFGTLQAKLANKFNSIEDIKNAENRIVSNSKEITKQYSELIENDMKELGKYLKYRSEYSYLYDSEGTALNDFAGYKNLNMANLNKALESNNIDSKNVPIELKQKIIDDIISLKNLPTDYFEAKPQRAVGLDEVQQIVIPNNLDAEFKKQLQDNGLQYTEYDPSIEGDRQRVINQFDDLKFSVDRIPISKNFLTQAEQNELEGLRDIQNSGWTDLTSQEQKRMQELENKANVVLDKKAEKMLRSASYKAINTTTKVAENYLDFDAKQKKDFRNQMREFSNMTKDELVNADTYNKVKDIVSQYANREYTYFDDTVEGIKRELKHTKIRVTDEMKNQITDYGYFVRDSKLMLRRNSGTPVDQVYQEYSEMYPNFFDTDVWNEADELERLNEFMNHDFSVTEKYRLTDEDLKNATDIIYNKLLDNSLSQQDLITTEEVLDKKVQKRTRTVVREELLDKMGITPELISEGNDISAISFARTDPIRVNEKVFGWKTGQLINDATVNFTKHQEAERMRFLNKERQEIKDLGIKARSKESELVQKYGEKQYVDKNNEVHPYTDAELNRDVKDVVTRQKIKNAARVLRQKYDTYIDRVNSVLTEMGYDEIPKRQDYMRHFVELDDKFSRWGLPFNKESMMAEDLPTDINGLTEFNRPGKNYFASANARTGLQTTYDAITGIDGYLEGVSNLIYHTESIQRYRALTRFIRENYGREHGLDNIDLMTDEELADRIKDIQDNKLSKYVAWLDEQANSIAGKKGSLDRSVERMFGRRVYTALNTLKSQVGSNMTGFNVRSAMTNFASAIQGMSKTQKLAFVKGTISTINNIIENDGLIDKSDFLTRRFGSDSLAMKPWQKLSKAGQIFMEGTDYFTANQIWRSKYYENLSKGMSEQQAIKNADDFAARIMGDRSKGSTAELFNSKTLGFLSQFQLEVNNQWSSLIHDNKMDIQRGNKTALGVTFELGQLFAASYLFNTLMKELTGSDVMIDPIDMLLKIFKPDDDDKDEGIVKRAQKVLGELINNLPFANLITGGGRIPISEAFTGVKTLGNKLIGGTDNYGNEITWGDVKDDALESLAYWVLPTGYGQLRKTVKGLSMYDDKLPIAGSYTDSGNLRFSAEDTAYGKAKAALFGQYSSRYAQDYIDSGYKSINASKLDEMKDLDMNSTEYRDYREGLSAAGTSIEDKLNYISDLDVSDEDKTIMASNVAKKDIDMSEYKKYGSYDEFNYAQKNPTKYEVMKLVGGYDTYKNYEKAISEITADYDRNGKAITNSRKNKVIKYVNSLNLTRAQKAMLIKEQYPSFTQYDSQIASYVNNQNMSFIQKAGILKQLGFKAYDRQIINYIRENYRTVEEQQEELEKLGFKIYNYNGKTYVR